MQKQPNKYARSPFPKFLYIVGGFLLVAGLLMTAFPSPDFSALGETRTLNLSGIATLAWMAGIGLIILNRILMGKDDTDSDSFHDVESPD